MSSGLAILSIVGKPKNVLPKLMWARKKENLAIVIRYGGTEREQCLHLFDFESGQSNFLIARYLANWIFWLICTMESTSIYTRKYLLTDELWNTSCFWNILPNTYIEPSSCYTTTIFNGFRIKFCNFSSGFYKICYTQS